MKRGFILAFMFALLAISFTTLNARVKATEKRTSFSTELVAQNFQVEVQTISATPLFQESNWVIRKSEANLINIQNFTFFALPKPETNLCYKNLVKATKNKNIKISFRQSSRHV